MVVTILSHIGFLTRTLPWKSVKLLQPVCGVNLCCCWRAESVTTSWPLLCENLTRPCSLNTGDFCFKPVLKIPSSTSPVLNLWIVHPVFSLLNVDFRSLTGKWSSRGTIYFIINNSISSSSHSLPIDSFHNILRHTESTQVVNSMEQLSRFCEIPALF